MDIANNMMTKRTFRTPLDGTHDALDEALSHCIAPVHAGFDKQRRFDASTNFSLDPTRFVEQISEVRASGIEVKPVLIGPVSYLWLDRSTHENDRLALLQRLLPVYRALLDYLMVLDVQWVQVDEPALSMPLDDATRQAFTIAYEWFDTRRVKLMLTAGKRSLNGALEFACTLPVDAVHVDENMSLAKKPSIRKPESQSL